MFWNDADPERSAESIHEIIDREWCNDTVEPGSVMTIQCALRFPNVQVRVIRATDDPDEGFDYELVDAASTEKGGNDRQR